MSYVRPTLWLGGAILGFVLIWVALRGRLRPSGQEVALQAYRKRVSGIWVQVKGEIFRTLPDDTEGTPHQRFVLRTAADQTLLVAYNLSGRPRIPLALGDKVEVRGEYEWSPEGGVIHNVHRGLSGRGPSGWVKLTRNGRKYE